MFRKYVSPQARVCHGLSILTDNADKAKALRAAYCDLLDFFIAARSVFTDKEGKVSRTYPRSFKLLV